MHFLHIANSDKIVAHYSLDVIISVGYRVKFCQSDHFRELTKMVCYLFPGVLTGFFCFYQRIGKIFPAGLT